MAIDSYMCFIDYNDKYLQSESQVDLKQSAQDSAELAKPFTDAFGQKGLFEVEDYSFDIEQTLGIGSQSTGAGAGKVTFNPFSITRKVDKSSPVFFQNACSGKAFKSVFLGMRKSAGNDATGVFFLVFQFKLVAVKTVGWAHDDEAPKETVTFEYGGLLVKYGQQNSNGQIAGVIPGGWNRVKNKLEMSSPIPLRE
jgi:type VI secretion system Hcp family effector